MRLVLLIILSVFFSHTYSSEQTSPFSFTLKNGMEVVVIQNKRAPVIAQMIWYNFGSGIEKTGKSGLAHFMEHLMFKGTRKFPDNYYSNFISKIGGSENAFTSYDYTAYYQVFPKSELKKMMKMATIIDKYPSSLNTLEIASIINSYGNTLKRNGGKIAMT